MKNIYSKALILSVLISYSHSAQAAHELQTPYVEKGEAEIEYFARRDNDSVNANNNFQKHSLAFGYGVTENWAVEVGGVFEKEADSETKFDSVEIENIFQLTEEGEYFVDVGAVLAYEHTPQANRANAVEAKLLLAKEYCKTMHIANLIIEDEIGSGGQQTPELKLLWSSSYELVDDFSAGFEISSDFGHINDMQGFDAQEHYIGPAAYGEIPFDFGNDGEIEYRLAYLFGVSDAAKDGEFIAQIGYEFEF